MSILREGRPGPRLPPPGRRCAVRLRPLLRLASRLPLSLVLILAVAPVLPSPAAAQDAGGWNGPRVLELVERAREARADQRGAEGLESYTADAEGHIYFFVDPAEGERALIRVDQVALETYWMAPDLSKQVVVGLRAETRLPVREFHYFVDRLSVIQNNFGDVIEIGEGSDVAGAPHPLAVRPAGAAAAGETPYDYRLADSVTVRLYGRDEPVRVYRVEVRPRDVSRAGVVGSVYLDRQSASIVRMDFTFTPASYLDRRNDWIRVTIDHGLWEGRHWLPNEQRIEVRRELPELDIGAGTVIRAVMRVTDYDLNVPLDPAFFGGRPVVARPPEERQAYPFRTGLLERLGEEGLREADRELDLRRIRAQAAELMRNQAPSGLPPLRLHLPALSSAFRFNRAEGLFLGAGAIWHADARVRLHASGGWGFGSERLSLGAEGRARVTPDVHLRLSAHRNRLEDIGPVPGSAGVVNTISSLFLGRDYLDPWFSDGVDIGVERRGERGWSHGLALSAARHRSAELVHVDAPLSGGGDFRPVRPVDEGTRLAARLSARRDGDPMRLRSYPLRFGMEAGTWEGRGFGRAEAAASLVARSPGFDRGLELTVEAGGNLGEVPRQHHFLLGGRQTLPGFPYRAFAGEHYARLAFDFSQDVRDGRWLRLHALGWAGWTHLGGGEPPFVDATDTGGVRASLGVGFGVLYDIARIELARGLNGGEWQLLFSVDPRWWDRL